MYSFLKAHLVLMKLFIYPNFVLQIHADFHFLCRFVHTNTVQYFNSIIVRYLGIVFVAIK